MDLSKYKWFGFFRDSIVPISIEKGKEMLLSYTFRDSIVPIIYYLVVQTQMVWIFFGQYSTNLAILTHYCLYQNTEMP
jgi:hypothetical protein